MIAKLKALNDAHPDDEYIPPRYPMFTSHWHMKEAPLQGTTTTLVIVKADRELMRAGDRETHAKVFKSRVQQG